MKRAVLFAAVVLIAVTQLGAAIGGDSLLAAPDTPDAFPLAQKGFVAPVVVSARDWPGVLHAADNLRGDLTRVTGLKSAASAAPITVLVGTLGHSELIDGLAVTGKLNAAAIRGRWEAFVIETIDHPTPDIDRALVIVGSDKRGTIYGVYELSQQIGVSPWHWWTDVPVPHRAELFLQPGRRVDPGPVVKYRGIFLNDEAPDLTNWIRATYGDAPISASPPVPAGKANYGHEFYGRLFDVMLRLRANYLWPAMWDSAFNEDDPANARFADECGIVMGTSHQEPMLRAQKEWDRRYETTLGHWNYAQTPGVLEDFWREGVRRNKNYESIVTLGLRGANDTEMAPGGPPANRALLEKIVSRQRDILRAEVNPDLTKVPQLWCLYKEVQDYYDAGLRVPDDVTLLWAEDNWGNLRRLPTSAERARPGGAGIYYHFDYHGSPRSYQWLDTSPLPKIWEQMSLAAQYGADRVWIVNVGHFKGYELPTEFFLNLAWNPARWTGANLGDFTSQWAAREFGPAHAAEIADLVTRYTAYNGRRKPEQLAPDTFSLLHYREAETVEAGWSALAASAEALGLKLPAEQRDAYFSLVLFPIEAGSLVNRLYVAAGRNALYARQGRASANHWAAVAQTAFQDYLALVRQYHTRLAGGKWNHFMDQPVLGYTTWRDPPANSLDHLKFATVQPPVAAALGVAAEGGAATPPHFDALSRRKHYVDIFNRGQTAFAFTATAGAPWITLSATDGQVGADQRLWIDIDWTKAPAGLATGSVTITGAGKSETMKLEAFNPAAITRATLDGFVESEGHVSIEAEHTARQTATPTARWTRIAGYGRTLSGLRAEGPVGGQTTPGRDAPCLEYKMYLFTTGPAEVSAITGPVLNFIPGRPVRYALAFDDEPPQVVTLVPADFKAMHGELAWEKIVGDNAHISRSKHTITRPGYHTLKIWMIDPAVVLQKLIIDLGGAQPCYLGPPESYHTPFKSL